MSRNYNKLQWNYILYTIRGGDTRNTAIISRRDIDNDSWNRNRLNAGYVYQQNIIMTTII